MLSSVGIETINFLAGSTLAKGIVKVFQKAMDYRDTLSYSSEDHKDARADRLNKMMTYLKKTCIPAFIDVVRSETNLEITRVHLTGTQQLTGFFAVSLEFDSWSDASQMLEMQTGQGTPPKSFRESLLEMQRMTEKFDITTGKLSSSVYGKGGKRKIKCEMYMDPMMAFLLHDFVPVSFSPLFTAEELAAVYLHEIGHVLTTVERSADLYQVTHRHTKHLITNLRNADPKQALQDFNEIGRPTLTLMAESSEGDKKTVAAIIKTLDALTYISEKETGSLVGAVLELFFRILINTILIAYITILQWLVIKGIMFFFVGLLTEFSHDGGGKQTDQTKTMHSIYQMERLADEFVARHGMSSSLASALNKMFSIFPAMMLGQTASTRLRKAGWYGCMIKFCVHLNQILGMEFGPAYNYEADAKRLKRMIQNMHAVFKNQLDPIMLGSYLSEYTLLEREVDKVTSRPGNVIWDNVLEYLGQYVNPAAILAMILTGRLSNDYEKQQNKVENLINNKLYYTAAQFKYLASKA